ncbi:MAG: 4-(cytidine 5'-diphospho)-2-C-methyl-D-erythritol kinase [Desulfurobacteriaceae bacterium]
MKLILPSPAKINLSLWVKGKRTDGYHEIITVMHTINLIDTISFLPADRLEFSIKGNNSLPLGKDNLIIKACKLFEEKTGIKPKVKITLEKKIPVGAGLGGGSSNAATTLKGLNIIYGKPLKEEELFELATQLGSDVPFFLKGGLAIAYGRGEKLKNYKKGNFKILLVYPYFSCSTKEVYEAMPPVKKDVSLEDAEQLIVMPLLTENLKELEENMENDLELSKALCITQVKEVKKALEAIGLKALMSGSGSSVFALIKEEKIDLTPLKKFGWWIKLLSAI